MLCLIMTISISQIFILCAGGILTYLAFMLGRKWALKFRFIDRPGGRKQHQGAVPPIGGLVIVPMFMALYLLLQANAVQDWALLMGIVILLLMGVVDDRINMRAGLKFAVQIFVAGLVVLAGKSQIDTLGNIWGTGGIYLGWISVPFSIACLVMMMNALNMMDGLDGLAGGVTFVILVSLICVAVYAGASPIGLLCLLIPLTVFLYFNMRHPWREKAAVFLGDSGSLTLGLILGWFCIQMTHSIPHAFPPVSAIWILAVPVIDALMLFFLRIRHKRHPFSADRNHLHHRFLDRGFSVGATTLLVMLSAWLCATIGLSFVVGVPEYVLFAGWCVGVMMYMAVGLRSSARRIFDSSVK
jgi:UDP-GlcNAc:undecaprenyl-phosphate GlcNAc-1-phosphate transferase